HRPSEQTTLGNGEPIRSPTRLRFSRVMYFADDQKEIVSRARIRIRRQGAGMNVVTITERGDIDSRKQREIEQVRGCEEACVVEPVETLEGTRCTQENKVQNE